MDMKCVNQIQEVMDFSKEELLDMLRKKVICEVETLLHSLFRGYRLDPQFILSEIYLIDTLSHNDLDEDFSKFALQYYLNNIWQTQS